MMLVEIFMKSQTLNACMHDDDNEDDDDDDDDDTNNKMPTISNSLFPQYIFEFGIIRVFSCYIHTIVFCVRVPLVQQHHNFYCLITRHMEFGLVWCKRSCWHKKKRTQPAYAAYSFFHSFFIGAHDVTFCCCLFNTIFEYAGSWKARGVWCVWARQWCGRAKKNIIDYPVRWFRIFAVVFCLLRSSPRLLKMLLGQKEKNCMKWITFWTFAMFMNFSKDPSDLPVQRDENELKIVAKKNSTDIGWCKVTHRHKRCTHFSILLTVNVVRFP